MVLRFRCIRNILPSWFSGSTKISGSMDPAPSAWQNINQKLRRKKHFSLLKLKSKLLKKRDYQNLSYH